jgi:hypothetical protein
MAMTRTYFDDGNCVVSDAVIATPHRIYPIANATARIRHDLLWIGLGLAGVVGAAIATYGDLLTGVELGAGVAGSGLLIAAGTQIKALSIDAFGHPRALIFGHRKKISTLFQAIRKSKLGRGSTPEAENTQIEAHQQYGK